MAGKNGRPIQLLLQDGKKHLTKAEIEHRENSEIRFGTNKLTCPDIVKNDIGAYKKWKELIKLYKDVDFISSGDVGLLSRYCITHSEYCNLMDKRDLYTSTLDETLKYQSLINKKLDLLLKMEDRLFLNPLAKVKNVPKKEVTKVNPLEEKGFGNV